MAKKKKQKESESQSGHTPISNRPDDEDFTLEEFVSQPPELVILN